MSSKQSNITLKFNAIVEGKEQLGELSVSARELGKAMKATQRAVDKTRGSLSRFSQWSAGFVAVQAAVQQLNAFITDLTGAYAVQEQAEKKLETVMRQRMGATEGQIASVKSLCSAQQELGVIGDEVQLQGAQQMATFLKEKSSLDALIPAMNNLVAQQKGLNATGQDAVNVGNLMGKAMQGQTSALRRVGITFDAAQEEVMKFGTESERAAMLAEIITQNVGEMNAALAQTDAGKIQQQANAMGDFKEWLGSFVVDYQNALNFGGQILMSAAALLQLGQGLTTAAKATGLLTVAKLGLGKAVVAVRTGITGLGEKILALTMGERAATMATNSLRASITGMLAATGIGLVISLACQALAEFIGLAGDATEATDELGGATDGLTDAKKAGLEKAQEMKQQIDADIESLKGLTDGTQEAGEAVAHLNTRYGEALGYYSSVGAWYDTLTRKSGVYIRQMQLEAEARELANRGASASADRTLAEQKLRETIGSNRYFRLMFKNETGADIDKAGYKDLAKFYNGRLDWINRGGDSVPGFDIKGLVDSLKTWGKATNEVAGYSKALNGVQGQLRDVDKQMQSIRATSERAQMSMSPSEMKTADIESQMSEIEKRLKNTDPTDTKSQNELIARYQALDKERASRPDLRSKGKGNGGPRHGATSQPEKVFDENATTAEGIDDNISILTKKLAKSQEAERGEIVKSIAAWKQKATAVELANMKAALPVKTDTFEEIDAHLEYQRRLYQTSTGEARKLAAAEMQRLNVLRGRKEAEAIEIPDVDNATTYAELDEAATAVEAKMRWANESERKELQKTKDKIEELRRAMQEAALDDIAPVGDIKSIEGFNVAIQRLRGGMESATDPAGVEAWARELMKYEKALGDLTLASELPLMEEELNKLTGLKGTDKYIIKVKEMGLDGIKSKIEELDEAINNTDDEGLKERLKGLRKQWVQLYKEASAGEKVQTAVGLISDSLSSLGGALSGSTGEILTWASQALTALSELTNMICAMIPALKTYATAQAVAGAASSGPLGWLMVGAAAASVIATFASMPKFAEGGLISGPTLGLMGEYAGAVNNPEVVAPLDKLRAMLQPVGGMGAGKVEFEIDGRVLRGVLRKVENLSIRS